MKLKILFEEITTEPLPYEKTGEDEWSFVNGDYKYIVFVSKSRIPKKIHRREGELSRDFRLVSLDFALDKIKDEEIDDTRRVSANNLGSEANKTFITVKKILDDYIKNNVSSIDVIEAIPTTGDKKSRAMLYARYLKNVAKENPEFDFVKKTTKFDKGYEEYSLFLVKNTISKEDLEEIKNRINKALL